MVWRHGSGSVALALALAGCTSFVNAEGGTEGSSDDSTGTGDAETTNATVNLSTSGATDSASGGPGTAPVTSNSDTSDTNPTDASNTDPSESDSDTDPSTGSGPGSTGASTTDGDTGEGTTEGGESTGPSVCEEADAEPNGDPINGVTQELPDQFCDTPDSTVAGTLLDEDDLDAFVFFGVWECGNDNNPNHRIEVDGAVTACVFPLCPNGIPTETNCIAGTPATANEVDGCCSNDTAIADVNCVVMGGDESAFSFILVESSEAECTDYTITYAVDDS